MEADGIMEGGLLMLLKRPRPSSIDLYRHDQIWIRTSNAKMAVLRWSLRWNNNKKDNLLPEVNTQSIIEESGAGSRELIIKQDTNGTHWDCVPWRYSSTHTWISLQPSRVVGNWISVFLAFEEASQETVRGRAMTSNDLQATFWTIANGWHSTRGTRLIARTLSRGQTNKQSIEIDELCYKFTSTRDEECRIDKTIRAREVFNHWYVHKMSSKFTLTSWFNAILFRHYKKQFIHCLSMATFLCIRSILRFE